MAGWVALGKTHHEVRNIVAGLAEGCRDGGHGGLCDAARRGIMRAEMRRCFLGVAVLMAAGCPAYSQTVERAVCGEDGKAHIVYTGGRAKVVAPEAGQTGCDRMTVAADGRLVGWSVLSNNCCTSYPIATAVAVMKDGRKRIFFADQSVWQWKFVEGDRCVAVLSGPVHGAASAALLFEVASGRRLAAWNGAGEAPAWARGWESQFR